MLLAYCSGCGGPLGEAPPCVCGRCGAEHWDNPKPCGGAFVAHDGRLLLVQRAREPWTSHWDVPGGFCDGAEHPEAAAVRELREETGLDVRLTGLLGMWIDRYGDETTYATLNVYFHAVADDLTVSAAAAPDEIAAVRWFTPAELADVPLAFPAHMRPAVAAWIASHPTP